MNRATTALPALFLLTTFALGACGGQVDDPPVGQEDDAIIGAQRSASGYPEAVQIKVNNAFADFCTGVIVSPNVVITAAHCVAFNPGGTWTITAPFAAGGAQTRTATSGELRDAAFAGLTRDNYESSTTVNDLAVLYPTTPFTGITPAIMSATAPAAGTQVSAIGRKTVNANATLVRSKIIALQYTTAADGYTLDYKSTRVTDGGDSGGPLFVEGTHKLVGTEALFDPGTNRDFWARLDGSNYTWVQGRIAAHASSPNSITVNGTTNSVTPIVESTATEWVVYGGVAGGNWVAVAFPSKPLVPKTWPVAAEWDATHAYVEVWNDASGAWWTSDLGGANVVVQTGADGKLHAIVNDPALVPYVGNTKANVKADLTIN